MIIVKFRARVENHEVCFTYIEPRLQEQLRELAELVFAAWVHHKGFAFAAKRLPDEYAFIDGDVIVGKHAFEFDADEYASSDEDELCIPVEGIYVEDFLDSLKRLARGYRAYREKRKTTFLG